MSHKYTLLYWGGMPGRGEYIRLPLEYTKTPYTEVNDPKLIVPHFSPEGQHFAPPILDVDGIFTLSQTPAIIVYLAPRLGLSGSNDIEQARINQLTFTALDMSNEAHDVHHPIASHLYYEEQKPEAFRRAEDFRKFRIPKFLTHFETVLSTNGNGVLVGTKVSTADLAIFHVLDGLAFAYPKRMATLRNEGLHKNIFSLQDRLGKELKGYLNSSRRKKYNKGIFRYYSELDLE